MTLKSERIQLGNGIALNLIQTDKFKSSVLSYYFIRPLSREEASKNAMLALVLKRGSQKYPTNLLIQRELEENYGASFSLGVNKRGDRHVLRFSLEAVNKKYVQDKDYIYKLIDLLKSIIFNPYLEGESFKKSYMDQEKENLKNRLESRINNKRSYAIESCIEGMCRGENFSIYPLGDIEGLEAIDGENLYEHYRDVMDTSNIEIFYTGEYDEGIIRSIKEGLDLGREDIVEIPREEIITEVEVEKNIEEDLDVAQGKLVLGYRTGISYEDKAYNGFLLGADILGGGSNSKLFKNVREEESLAYYISASVYKYNSIMLIDGGIEFDDYKKTLEIINQQIQDLQNGDFTDKDIEISKKSMKSSIESIRDNVFLISEFFFSQRLSGDNRSLEKILEDIDRVSREDIIRGTSKIKLDTVYFMKNSKDGIENQEV